MREVRRAPLRVLYVLPYVPSPIRVRPFQLIRALAKAGHRVTVVALADSFATPDALTELQAVTDAVHIVPHPTWRGALQAAFALPTPVPLWAAFCFSGAMTARLRRLVATEAFDVAHIEHLRAAHFAPALAPLPVVFDAVDCLTALRRQMRDAPDTPPVSRLLSSEEWHKLRVYEPQVCRQFAQVAVTSDYDARELRGLGENLPPVSVIPNGVDGDYFSPDESIAPIPYTLAFSGKMSYHANSDAARFLLSEILPRLRRLIPGASVTIVGSKPPDWLRALAAQTGGVTVTGYVDDLRPHLLKATVAVCPMRIGVGIQNKALEAMAVGRPVVCSPIAARALSGAVTAGAGVRVADTADEWTEVCADWLSAPPDVSANAGRAARAYVETHHDWHIAAQSFAQLYEKVIAAPISQNGVL